MVTKRGKNYFLRIRPFGGKEIRRENTCPKQDRGQAYRDGGYDRMPCWRLQCT